MSDFRHQEINSTKIVDDSLDLLPPNFQPSEWDVICQRGKECFEHVGNRRFRAAIDRNIDRYLQAPSRKEKSSIISDIVGMFRAVSTLSQSSSLSGGGFVRKDLLTRRWHRVGDKVARVKAGQALRDVLKARHAIEKKRVHGAKAYEQKYNFPSLMTPLQHSFEYDTSSLYAHDDDERESSSIGPAFNRCSAGLDRIKKYDDVIRRTHVDSLFAEKKGIPHLPTSGRTLGSSEKLQEKKYDPFLLTLGCKPPHEYQILSELEPRPISSGIYDKKTSSIVRNLEQEAPTISIMESTGFHREKNSPMMVTVMDDEQTPQVFAAEQNRRSENRESSSQLLSHFVHSQSETETGNYLSPYCPSSFISTNSYTSHLPVDEFVGFCETEEGLQRQILPRRRCATFGGSCDGSIMHKSTCCDMDPQSSTSTGGAVVPSCDATCGRALVQHPSLQEILGPRSQSLLPQEGRQKQHFLPCMFGGDQFLTMSRGGGRSAKSYSSSHCHPDISKSNNVLPMTSMIPRACDGNDPKLELERCMWNFR